MIRTRGDKWVQGAAFDPTKAQDERSYDGVASREFAADKWRARGAPGAPPRSPPKRTLQPLQPTLQPPLAAKAHARVAAPLVRFCPGPLPWKRDLRTVA
eukprot:2051938-Prymnesium_polylepis.1